MQEVENHPEQYTDTFAFLQTTVVSQKRKTVRDRSTTREPVHEEAGTAPHPEHKLIKGSSQ